MVQFPVYNCHFIHSENARNLFLGQFQVKPSLPDMIAYGDQSLWIGFGNRLFCLNFKVAEWQRNHVLAETLGIRTRLAVVPQPPYNDTCQR